MPPRVQLLDFLRETLSDPQLGIRRQCLSDSIGFAGFVGSFQPGSVDRKSYQLPY